MILRPYQRDAIVEMVLAYRNRISGGLVVLPTGAGKSLVIAGFAKVINEPILILQPSKEILEQNVNKLRRYVQEEDIGIYTASCGQKVVNKFTFGIIQSVIKHPQEFAHFKVVLIDEAHKTSPDPSTQYRQFIKNLSNPFIVGLTASPYRQEIEKDWTRYQRGQSNYPDSVSKIKFLTRQYNSIWKTILFSISHKELVDNGFLSPLSYYKDPILTSKGLKLNKARTDFDEKSMEETIEMWMGSVVKSIQAIPPDRKHIIVFVPTVKIAEELAGQIENSESIDGSIPKKKRAEIIARFKSGETRILFNAILLGIGFDFPELDTIVLIRATRSLNMYYQFLGRGSRIAPDKKDCMFVDLTDTSDYFGHIESIRVVKSATGFYNVQTTPRDEPKLWHDVSVFSTEWKEKKKRPIIQFTDYELKQFTNAGLF